MCSHVCYIFCMLFLRRYFLLQYYDPYMVYKLFFVVLLFFVAYKSCDNLYFLTCMYWYRDRGFLFMQYLLKRCWSKRAKYFASNTTHFVQSVLVAYKTNILQKCYNKYTFLNGAFSFVWSKTIFLKWYKNPEHCRTNDFIM